MSTSKIDQSLIDAKARDLLSRSPEEIEGMTVKQLRPLASGLITSYCNLKKDDLVKKLIIMRDELEKEYKPVNNFTAEPTAEPVAEPVTTSEPVAESTAELISKKDKISDNQKLKEIENNAIGQLQSGESFTDKLLKTQALANDYLLICESYPYHPSTFQSFWKARKGELLERIKGFSKTDDDYYRLITEFKALFENTITLRINAIKRENNDQYKARMNTIIGEQDTVEVSKLWQWSYDVLSTGLDKARYEMITIALAFVTGRRASEIHCSAMFETAYKMDKDGEETEEEEKFFVNFTGQSKGRGGGKNEYATESNYIVNKFLETKKIPCLVPAELVFKGVQRLQELDKRIPCNHDDFEATQAQLKVAHNKFATPLFRYQKKVFSYCGLPETIGGLKVSFKTTRDLYAVTTATLRHLYGGEKKSINKWIADVLGHYDTNVASYYQKIQVTGLTQIEKMLSEQ